ncbi:autotransporter domain-containing protein [Stenotrophomonas sp. PS02289]|uniref:autotransporter outer membrane beta-barrel domain-containing protein n=1 Tax=Stenotrophomonas sp. PS02289 TaxID=2991422 RepID=UPI00249B78F8|nr:autotransporter domain-containing protein [Stenotrophomonas sp. PS02289]
MTTTTRRTLRRATVSPLSTALFTALGLASAALPSAFANLHQYTTDEEVTDVRTHKEGFEIGTDTTATVTVSGKGALHAEGAVNVGQNRKGDGTLIVTGPDAVFTSAHYNGTDVGYQGKGRLLIQNGARVGGGHQMRVGVLDGSTGVVHVTGAGSRLHLDDLYVGERGDALPRVDNGGKVEADELRLGFGVVATGQRGSRLEISGAGSEVDARYAFIGGTLRVTDGGTLKTRGDSKHDTHPGLSDPSIITGTGSRWEHDGHLEVLGALDVRDGGMLAADSLRVSANGVMENRDTDLRREQLRVTGAGAVIKAKDGILIESDSAIHSAAITASEGGRIEANGKLVLGAGGYLVLGGAMGDGGAPFSWNAPVAAGELDDSVVTMTAGSGGVVFNHNGTINVDHTLRSDRTARSGLVWTGGALINQAGTTVLGGDLSEFGGMIRVQGGTLVINTNTFEHIEGYKRLPKVQPIQTMLVEDGTLVLNGTSGFLYEKEPGDASSTFRTAWASVRGNGRLAGTGTVGNTWVYDGGRLSPGQDGIGTFNVEGDLYFNAGGVGPDHVDTKAYLDVDVRADGASDRVKVSGTAHIGVGSTIEGEQGETGVRVTTLDPDTSYQAGQRYTILEADGGVTGGFDDVVTNSAFITGTLVQTDKAVHLDLALVTEEPEEETIEGGQERLTVFGRVAHTSNQRATAAALDSLHQSGDALALYNQLLMQDEESARRSFDELSGEAYASTRALLLRNDFLRTGVLAHLRTDPAEVANGSRAWITGGGDARSQRSDGNAAARRDHSEGLLMGYDFSFGEGWTVGAAGGRQSMRQQVRERGTRSEVDALHSGVYAAFRRDALWLRGGVSYADFKVETERSLGAGQPWEQHLRAHYRANAVSTFSEVGIDLPLQTLTLTPYLGLAHTTLSTGGSVEGEGSAALQVLPGRDRVWTTTTGMRAAWDVGSGERNGARIEGGLAWQNQQGDRTVGSTQAFVVGSDAFTVYGAPLARNRALAEIGVVLRPTGSSRVNLFVQGQRGGGERGFAAQASWNVMF